MSNKLLAGRYELIEKIGEGGMAVVYKAKDRLLNRYIAIKILRPEFTKDEQFIENFKRESQAAAALSHPNIVSIYDVGKEGNIHYIVMELIEGKPLSTIIEEKGRLDYKETINITKQVASALSIAHKNQIIHRDVKPHNILITNTGVAKLADFGIARAVTNTTIVNSSNKIMGSVHYFSPEQARGAYVDERSDIYSLGIVMYEMLTGKVPYDGDNAISIALMHINESMPLPSATVSNIPPQLEKIIMKATDKYQSNRYRTADELIEDLDNIDFITKVMGNSAFISKESSENNSATRKDKPGITSKPEDSEIAELIVKEPEKAEKERKKTVSKSTVFIIVGMAIVIIAGIIGLGSMLGWFGQKSEEIEVPDFKGYTLEEAQAEAEEKGLQIVEGDSLYSPDQEAGKITSQSPSAGSIVMEGKTITVNISLGKKDNVVPSIEGKDYKEAEEYLETFGFELGLVVKVTNSLPDGTIISQSVKAGTTAAAGTKIDVEVSDGKGKEMGTVPNLIGKTPDEAMQLIAAEGFTWGEPTYEETEDIAKNLVIKQQYDAGIKLEKGTSISVTISKAEKPEGSGSEGDGEMEPTDDPQEDPQTPPESETETE